MKGTTISLAELITRAHDSRLGDVWTALPGRIKVYDPATRTADVEPVLKRPVPTEEETITHEDLPIIPNVPVAFPRGSGGTCYITWPLVPGDHVMLVFTTLAMGQWRTKGIPTEPGDVRLHGLGSCMAYPGIGPDAEALPGAVLPALVVESPAIMLGAEAVQPVALGAATLAWMKAVIDAVTLAGFAPVPPSGPDLPYALVESILSLKVKSE